MSTSLPILETPRLELRRFEMADAKEIQRLAGDSRIADTTLRIPHPYEDGMAEAWIAHQAETAGPLTELVLAIVRKEDSALLGAIGLAGITGTEAELGYWVGVPYWNRGYCSEAGLAVLEYAFFALRLQRVHADHFKRNPASGRVMEKLGMKRDLNAKKNLVKDNPIPLVRNSKRRRAKSSDFRSVFLIGNPSIIPLDSPFPSP